MRVPGGIDPNENLCNLPCRVSSELTKCLQVHNRWKLLLESLEDVSSQQHYHFSAGEVSLNEQAGHGAAAQVLWQLGSRGMTVSDLVFCLEKLKWEQELRLLKAPESVQIVSHPPAKLHVREGERVTLDCKASGFPFPRYEWLVSKIAKEPAEKVDQPTRIASQLVISCATLQDAGKYVCRVRNDYSCTDSRWCKLTVDAAKPIRPTPIPPAIPPSPPPENRPERLRTETGQLLGLNDGGSRPFDNPDGRHGNNIVRLSTGKGGGGTRSADDLPEQYGPYITRHPTPTQLSVPLGQSVIMSVEAYGNPPPVYRWYLVHRGRGTAHPVEDIKGPTLQIPKTNETHNGNYYCEVSNHISSVKSDPCQLFVYPDDLPDNPKINREPQSLTKSVDDLVVLEVKAKGKGLLTYQWFKDGHELPGATKSRLEFVIQSSKDAGSYQCLVSCPQTRGKTMSNSKKPARLNVKFPTKEKQKFKAKDKIALVIGANLYEMHNKPLPASKFDAKEISRILTELGFSVISLLDPSKEEILKSIDMFCKLLETPVDKGTAHHSGMYAVFYWAGHGCYHLGDSYLIPYDVGAQVKLDDCISVDYIRSKMLRMDPSLCLLLLDMCREEAAEGAMIMPTDYIAHLEGKKARSRHDHDNVPYGNHCTIYATSIGQEAFEEKGNCSIFMQCFRKAIEKNTKNLYELYDALLEELSKSHHKADGKQNPEAVANIKQNRTLGDEKEHTDHTEIVYWRRVQWENTHNLPEAQELNFDDLGIGLFLSYENFLSNMMIMNVKVLRLGAVKAIHKIETEHEPQKVHIALNRVCPAIENTWQFQVWALQRLKTDLIVKVRIHFKIYNDREGQVERSVNLGRPLISRSPLWNRTFEDTTEVETQGGAMGATGGRIVNDEEYYAYGVQHQMPDVLGKPAYSNEQPCEHPMYGNVLPYHNQASGRTEDTLYDHNLHDQQLALASGQRICQPEQEDPPDVLNKVFPHQQYLD